MSSVNGEVDALLFNASLVFLRDQMCVKRGEEVLLTSDSAADGSVVQALQIAAHALGAKAPAIVLDPPLPFQGLLADPHIPRSVAAAAQDADVWVDLAMPYYAGSYVFDKVMHNGRTRYFLGAGMTAGAMVRLFGQVDLDALYAASAVFDDFIARAADAGKEFHITTPAGTDVRFKVLNLPADGHIGISKATRPGGFFAPGTSGMIPILESVKGTIACEVLLHEYYTVLADPILIKVDGTITDVVGSGPEMKVMDRALRRAGNGAYGGIVHFSCGHHPAARFTGTCFNEDQRVLGYNAVGFGYPPGMPGGGENHPDSIMRDQSIWIDGELIVERGAVVGPDPVRKAIDDLAVIYS